MLLKIKPKAYNLPYIWPSETKEVIFDAIEDNGFQHIHLIGKSGIGKTRYLSELIRLLKKDNKKEIIDCSSYDERNKNTTILEVITDHTLSQEQIQGYENPYDLITYYAQSKDIIIIIDDFHYADDSINHFIKKLAYKLNQQNDISVTLITASRKEFSSIITSNFQSIELNGLSLRDASVLIEKECKKNKILKTLQKKLVKTSDGHPLYIAEAINITTQVIKDPNLKLNPSDFSSINNIDDLYNLIFSTLNETQQKILYAGSVIGKKFSSQNISLLLPAYKRSIQKHLQLLCRKNILVRYEIDGEYGFTHDKQLENIYKNLNFNEKWKWHLKEAEKYKKARKYDLCGYHYYFSESYEESIKYLTFTARKALRKVEPIKAELFFKRALTAFEVSYLSYKYSYFKLQADYCYLLLMQGRLSDAKDIFLKLEKHSNANSAKARNLILELEINLKWMSGYSDNTYVLNLLDSLPKTPSYFTDRSRLIGMLSDSGYHQESIKRIEELLYDIEKQKISKDKSFSSTSMACEIMLSIDYATIKKKKTALKHIQENIYKVSLISDGPDKIYALTFITEALHRVGCYEEARPLIEKAYELNLDFKIGIIHPHIISRYAHNLAFFGNYIKALELFDECLSFNEKNNFMSGVPYFKILMAQVYSSMCMERVAIDILKSAEQIALEQHNDYYLALVYYELSLIIINVPEMEEGFSSIDAKEYLAKCMHIATKLNFINLIEKCKRAFKCIL